MFVFVFMFVLGIVFVFVNLKGKITNLKFVFLISQFVFMILGRA